MIPNAIAIKMQALKQDLVLAGAAVDEGNLLRAQKLLQNLQRSNAGLLRLLEMQLSGASAPPHTYRQRLPVEDDLHVFPPTSNTRK
jgi:hypothetical protein